MSQINQVDGSVESDLATATAATYPPYPDDEIMPGIPTDPVPNPEPEQPSLGEPDPGIYEGTGGTAELPGEEDAAR